MQHASVITHFGKSLMASVIMFLISSTSVCAQQTLDVVYLKNGSIIRGEIVELIPNDRIKIQTRDGSLFVYEMAEVERIMKEQVSPSQRQQQPDPQSQSTGSSGQQLAQSYNTGLSRKDPATATVLSVLVTGGGQLYAGETRNGLGLLLGSIGATLVGYVVSDFTGESNFHCDSFDCYYDTQDPDITPFWIGLGISGAMWLYGVIDASNAARRTNRERGFMSSVDFSPMPIAANGTWRPGISMQISF